MKVADGKMMETMEHRWEDWNKVTPFFQIEFLGIYFFIFELCLFFSACGICSDIFPRRLEIHVSMGVEIDRFNFRNDKRRRRWKLRRIRIKMGGRIKSK